MNVSRAIRGCFNAAMRMRKRGGGNAPTLPASLTDVTRLCDGTWAQVVTVQGGGMAAKRLAAMGVVPGAIIIKKRSSPLKGPVVLEKGTSQFAIGYGMALRLIVQPLDGREQEAGS